MKKLIVFIVLIAVLFCPRVCYATDFGGELSAQSAILIEAESGTVLFEKNADERRFPASVTKVMTLLLVFEALDAGRLKMTDVITASEYAASMGGSQIFLSPGESMSAEEMIKSVIISSANDAATALAEHIAGSEDAFVGMMNKRAAELQMVNTRFENVNGLDDTATDHKTTARDIAIMSRELITKHPKVLEYSGIWMDSIRDGAFGLSNTNRLIRFYSGATGLKTGSTAKAGFCISATAERGGMQLIAVIMGAPNRDARNADAKALLDFGFSNYEAYGADGGMIEHISVKGGNVAEF
ncbi:MAG: D-alanyl-D-alanine carboxypeptidase, partial [Clostridia bacterium]|nr:D-alanyl-D-alanine carboxypeptidase [Clostridia bacterium]